MPQERVAVYPQSAEAWQGLSDGDLVVIGQDYGAHVSVIAQAESMRRLKVALIAFKESADSATARLCLADVGAHCPHGRHCCADCRPLP
jgi:DNA-binding MurR/RpiR family transcriptional regulator